MLPLDTQAIFRTYDIRGVFGKTLNEPLMHDIGRALAEEVVQAYPVIGHYEIVVGWDGRLSASSLSRALIDGLKRGGAHVRTLGMLPTPATYLAAHEFTGGHGIMITGSHNPSEYNGCKMMIAGETLAAERIEALRDRIMQQILTDRSGGTESPLDFLDLYQSRIVNDVPLERPLKVVVDCGNAVTGVMARSLFCAMGCQVEVLFEEIDGHFPHHHPDPSQEKNLVDIRTKMTFPTDNAHPFDVGLAFDGDGDRVGIITRQGQVFSGDQLLMLFAEHMLPHYPGAKVLYDVKCSSQLAPWIRQHGGIPEMTHTGHALIKRAIRQTGAKLAGEMSGHIFFNDRWPGFDDAVYAAARLLQIVAQGLDLDEWLAQFPKLANTPELNIECAEGEAHALVKQIQNDGQFDNAKINTIDGVRAEFPCGFGLVRASNTTPVLVLRFEAIDQPSLIHIQHIFARELRRCKTNIVLPF